LTNIDIFDTCFAMRAREFLTELKYEELTLDEELASVDENFVFEMANLPSDQTGVRGIIFISTKMAKHGARVKYYLKPGGSQPSFSVSISANPEVVASSLPARVVNRAAPKVIEWVAINNVALLRFWNTGNSMTLAQVNAFVATLQKV
jgi:hypothetical protein